MKVSFIMIHYSSDDLKSELARKCLKQLYSLKDADIEIIFINNGKKDEVLKQHCDICLENEVNSLGGARNKGINVSCGEYICIIDNDIFVEKPFWNEAIGIIERHPERKLIVGMIPTRNYQKYDRGELEGMRLNDRISSNCFLLKRSSFNEIGWFDERIITKETRYTGKDGSKFTDRQIRKGYQVVLLNGYAKDLGVKGHKYIYE